MFDDDDDGLFDLVDDPLEWDLLLDDDELENDRRRAVGKKDGASAASGVRIRQDGKKRHRGLFGGLFG